MRCDVRVVCWLDACTAAWSGIGVGGLLFVARVALLACVGGLTFIVRVCLWWFPALVPACLCIPNHRVSLSHGLSGGYLAFMHTGPPAPDSHPA